mmetsp:Transcript_23100/g.87367  ORF Transcript_23100/g.87367 Transcript_23100/m.87367 type:complete len:211 (-) Transcript_23100:2572-3204(-)
MRPKRISPLRRRRTLPRAAAPAPSSLMLPKPQTRPARQHQLGGRAALRSPCGWASGSSSTTRLCSRPRWSAFRRSPSGQATAPATASRAAPTPTCLSTSAPASCRSRRKWTSSSPGPGRPFRSPTRKQRLWRPSLKPEQRLGPKPAPTTPPRPRARCRLAKLASKAARRRPSVSKRRTTRLPKVRLSVWPGKREQRRRCTGGAKSATFRA